MFLITGALVLYTSGVFAEQRAGSLQWFHVGLFAGGLTLDMTGTFIMCRIAAATQATPNLLNQIMAITGLIALLLMAGHLIWAFIVMIRDRPNERLVFHRLSVIVWAIWLVPYFTGMIGSFF
ncbi:HsmA family protein [Arcanobacterium bovis]|uniref:TIGR03987 family protein n=1 Tax=Arcanobacterium bovis TaxID=2529275 RepID=A0A4Q9V1Q7_9ACTO|nr:HsmA family protein [Arcanobacterium bovis]TBW22983.1 TIGR03987 family protein [Arcanobacterium bovis]